MLRTTVLEGWRSHSCIMLYVVIFMVGSRLKKVSLLRRLQEKAVGTSSSVDHLLLVYLRRKHYATTTNLRSDKVTRDARAFVAQRVQNTAQRVGCAWKTYDNVSFGRRGCSWSLRAVCRWLFGLRRRSVALRWLACIVAVVGV